MSVHVLPTQPEPPIWGAAATNSHSPGWVLNTTLAISINLFLSIILYFSISVSDNLSIKSHIICPGDLLPNRLDRLYFV